MDDASAVLIKPLRDTGIEVVDWFPSPDGSGRPTQVHILLNLGDGAGFALRLKTRIGADQLISALIEHRDRVWPPKEA